MKFTLTVPKGMKLTISILSEENQCVGSMSLGIFNTLQLETTEERVIDEDIKKSGPIRWVDVNTGVEGFVSGDGTNWDANQAILDHFNRL